MQEAVAAKDGCCEIDPYGSAVWPAGQVLAQAVAAYLRSYTHTYFIDMQS